MKRFVLIGTAPSLTVQQMKTVEREETFGCGHLITWSGLPYVPKWYGVSEEVTFVALRAMLERTDARLVAALPVPREHFPTIAHKPSIYADKERYGRQWPLLTGGDRWEMFATAHADSLEYNEWGPQTVADGKMVMCWPFSGFIAPLQYAAAQEPDQIVLLGMDLTFVGYLDHEKERRTSEDIALKREVKVENLLQKVQCRCDELGIEIVNCSPGYEGGAIRKRELRHVLDLRITRHQVAEAKRLGYGNHVILSPDRHSGLDLIVDADDYGTMATAIPATGTNVYASRYYDNSHSDIPWKTVEALANQCERMFNE